MLAQVKGILVSYYLYLLVDMRLNLSLGLGNHPAKGAKRKRHHRGLGTHLVKVLRDSWTGLFVRQGIGDPLESCLGGKGSCAPKCPDCKALIALGADQTRWVSEPETATPIHCSVSPGAYYY